jgi:hypothetical protein
METALESLMPFGERAVDRLRDRLRGRSESEKGFAGMVLADIGSEQAYGVLVDALRGRTGLETRLAAVLLASFVERNLWEPARARQVAGAGEAALEFLRDSSSYPEQTAAVHLVVALQIKEALPELQRLARAGERPQQRWRAAEAFFKLSGTAAPFVPANERFGDVSIQEDLLKKLVSVDISGEAIFAARLVAHPAGGSAIAAFHQARADARTGVRVLDASGEIMEAYSIAGLLSRPLMPRAAGQAQVPAMVALQQNNVRDRGNCVAAFDFAGNRLWSHELEAGSFGRLTCLYGTDRQPYALVVSGSDRVLATMSLDGRLHSAGPVLPGRILAVSECIPDRLLAYRSTTGYIYTLDSAGVVISEAQSGSIYDAVFVPGGDGDYTIVCTTAADGQPMLTFLDSSMAELATCQIAGPIGAIAPLYGRCDDESAYVLVLCRTGELLAIDMDGVLRWRGQVADQDGALSSDVGLDILRDDAEGTATILAHWSQRVTVWRYAK